MLLVLDVGNTNTVLGVYEMSRARLCRQGRLTSPAGPLARGHRDDPYGGRIRRPLPQPVCHWQSGSRGVSGIIISSVVPPMDSTLREVCERYFHLKPLFVEPGIKTGMPVLYENPQRWARTES